MEVKKKKKSDFSAISINRIVAERFRGYSKKTSKSHTDTLESMMDFFEGAKISPKNKYLMDYMGLNHYMDRRLDYLEELLRQWEKNSSIPKINDMLTKVFDFAEEEDKRGKKLLELERKNFENSLRSDRVTKYDIYMLKEERKKERRKVLSFLDKIKMEKPMFGEPYFRLDFDEAELEEIKRGLMDKL